MNIRAHNHETGLSQNERKHEFINYSVSRYLRKNKKYTTTFIITGAYTGPARRSARARSGDKNIVAVPSFNLPNECFNLRPKYHYPMKIAGVRLISSANLFVDQSRLSCPPSALPLPYSPFDGISETFLIHLTRKFYPRPILVTS